MCQIQAIQFVKNGTSYFPGCSATLSDTIGVEVLVNFDSSEVNKRYYCFLQYQTPSGSGSRYVSDTPALISSAGTYSFSIFRFVQSTDPTGTYRLQTATILDEAKSVSVCYGSASGSCTSVDVQSASPTTQCNDTQYNVPGFGCQDKQTIQLAVGAFVLLMMLRQ